MQLADKIRFADVFSGWRTWWVVAGATFLFAASPGWGATAQEEPEAGRRVDSQQADRLYDQWRMGVERQILAHADDMEGSEPSLARWLVPRLPDRRYFFVPLADARPPADQRPPKLDRTLVEAAAELFELTRKTASYAPDRSYRWLHEVLFLDPDHQAARRILGHRSVRGAWRVGPEPRVVEARRPLPWLRWPAGRYWEVTSPHFHILTDKSAEAGGQLAVDLELLHCVWQQLFFSFWSDRPTLLTHWQRPATPWIRHQPLEVVLFRDREEYLDQLRPYQPRIELTLGYYAPQRGTVFFYSGDKSLQATWWHEATHQFFDQYRSSRQPMHTESFFGLVEAVAMYMESLQLYPGYVTLGGIDASRLQAARHRELVKGFHLPMADLLAMGQQQWQGHPEIRAIYSQAAGLAHLILDRGQPDDERALQRLLTAIYVGRGPGQTGRPQLASNIAGWERSYRGFLQVSDEQLQQVALVGRPTQLALGGTWVSDKGLAAVGQMTSLQWLDLTGTSITDKGLASLRHLVGLEYLGLAETGVTDQGVRTLAALDRLRELDLSGTAVSEATVAWLHQQLPRLESTRTGPSRKGD